MAVVTQVLIGIIAALHIYFFLLETVLFKTRGRRVFGLTAEKAEIMAPSHVQPGLLQHVPGGRADHRPVPSRP
ncbi:DUF1304 domain-containing protein [Massilia sp. H-1]|nr:DUF1304 domain-containing protein [Massilia sp. H-1]